MHGQDLSDKKPYSAQAKRNFGVVGLETTSCDATRLDCPHSGVISKSANLLGEVHRTDCEVRVRQTANEQRYIVAEP